MWYSTDKLLLGMLALGHVVTSRPAPPSNKARAEGGLTLAHASDLLAREPDVHDAGQSIWEMHKVPASLSSLVRLDGPTPWLSHPAVRRLLVLEGGFSVVSASESTPVTTQGYVEIPPYTPYQLVPKTNSTPPTMVSFDVPAFDIMKFSYPGDVATEPFDALSIDKITVLSREDITAREPSWIDPTDIGWSLIKTKLVRVNFSIWNARADLRNHYHPDADHSLVLLSGRARVVTPDEEAVLEEGDYVSLPKNVPHKYTVMDVEGREDQRAVFISFDAPPYDSKNTVYLDG